MTLSRPRPRTPPHPEITVLVQKGPTHPQLRVIMVGAVSWLAGVSFFSPVSTSAGFSLLLLPLSSLSHSLYLSLSLVSWGGQVRGHSMPRVVAVGKRSVISSRTGTSRSLSSLLCLTFSLPFSPFLSFSLSLSLFLGQAGGTMVFLMSERLGWERLCRRHQLRLSCVNALSPSFHYLPGTRTLL